MSHVASSTWPYHHDALLSNFHFHSESVIRGDFNASRLSAGWPLPSSDSAPASYSAHSDSCFCSYSIPPEPSWAAGSSNPNPNRMYTFCELAGESGKPLETSGLLGLGRAGDLLTVGVGRSWVSGLGEVTQMEKGSCGGGVRPWRSLF